MAVLLQWQTFERYEKLSQVKSSIAKVAWLCVTVYRPESDGEHTAGSVQQRDRQHGWTDCPCSAAESDAFSWGPRHPRQPRIRDRSRLVTGLNVLLVGVYWPLLYRKVRINTKHTSHVGQIRTLYAGERMTMCFICSIFDNYWQACSQGSMLCRYCAYSVRLLSSPKMGFSPRRGDTLLL